MNIDINEENFSEFSNEWSLLLNSYKDKTVFHTYTWHKVWWDTFSNNSDLKLLSIRNSDELIGIAPFMIKDKSLSFMGDTNLFDYHDVILLHQSNIIYDNLWKYIQLLEWDKCVFKSLPNYSGFLNFFRQIDNKDFEIVICEEDSVPVLNLNNTWEEYLQNLNKKHRHELKRKFRRLNDTNKNIRQYFSKNASTIDYELTEFFRLLKLSSPEKSDFLTEEIESFFTKIFKALFKENILRLYFMEIDDTKVAACICFDYNNVYSLYNSGYDTNYSYLSVGLLNKALCIKESLELNYDKFNFLRGSERYKYSLGGMDQKIFQISITR